MSDVGCCNEMCEMSCGQIFVIGCAMSDGAMLGGLVKRIGCENMCCDGRCCNAMC